MCFENRLFENGFFPLSKSSWGYNTEYFLGSCFHLSLFMQQAPQMREKLHHCIVFRRWGFWGFDWLNNKNWFNRRTLCRVDLLLALSWVCLIIEISKVAGQYLLLSAAEWSPSTLSIGCVEFSKQKREEENSSIVDCIRATKPLSINES